MAKKATRSRYFMVILYPDNMHHVDIMEYLQGRKKLCFPYQACYILHSPESDEKKEHWHVLLHFPNARTVEGVCKSFGSGNFRKVGEEWEAVNDVTGIPEEEIEVRPLVTPALCSTVSDVHGMAMYLLHKNYECLREGKKEYVISDIKACNNDFEFVNSIFEVGKTTSQGGEVYEIINDFLVPYKIKNMTDLILTLFTNGRGDLVKYVESHAYLIKNLL